jgi:hypothetical protein
MGDRISFLFLFLLCCFIERSVSFTARETLEISHQCKNICGLSKTMHECRKACVEALEHRMRNYPNLPEQLKKLKDLNQPPTIVNIVDASAKHKQPVSQKFVKPGRMQLGLRK